MNKTHKDGIHQPFDAAWKQGMREIEVARDLFHRHLPAHVKTLIDFSTLTFCNTSYVDDSAKQTHSDVVYRVKTQQGAEGYLYLLSEQQRAPDKYLLLRLYSYTLRIIEDHTKQGYTHFPIVFPFVYYNGMQTPYPHSMNFWSYFAEPKKARKLMGGPVYLVDVNMLSDTFSERDWAGLLELLLKNMRSGDDFLPRLKKLAASGNLTYVSEHGGRNYLQCMLNLCLQETRITDKHDFLNTVKGASSELGENIMTLLQKEYDLGKREGKQEGKKEGLIEGEQKGEKKGKQAGKLEEKKAVSLKLFRKGFSMPNIQEITGLSEQLIRGLIIAEEASQSDDVTGEQTKEQEEAGEVA